MTAFMNHFAFEFKTGMRNPTQLMMNYLFPLGFYAMMGVVMTAVNPLFTRTMIPALVIFAALSSAVLGLPSPLVESREAGIYRSFKINGVPAPSILAVPTLTTIFHVLIVAVIITVTAPALFNGAAPVNWGAFLLLTLLTAFTSGSIGALIGVVSANSRATVLWSQLIFLPSMLLGGLMMPLSFLPDSVRRFSALLPPAHAIQAFVGLAYNEQTVMNPVASALILLVSGVLAYALAIYLFNWDNQNSARRGHPLMALVAFVPYAVAALLM
jgi:ABC-2 type transport system permease protein